MLNKSAEEFYELAPIEFKYAVKVVNERELDKFKTQYEVARYLARHIWNSAGKTLKHPYQTVQDLGRFGWEEEKSKNVQTPEEVKRNMLNLFGGRKLVKRDKKGKKK